MSITSPTARLFEPVVIGKTTLRNRLAVAPMTGVSADEQGHATDVMADYYGAFADGGFALVVTEGIYTDAAWSQGYFYQPGLVDDAQRDAWAAVVERTRSGGARIVAQLMHAGALSQGNRFRDGTRGPSASRPKGQQMSFYRGSGAYPVPAAMTPDEIYEVVAGFAAAAERSREAGFDGVEIHGANGYLLDQFLSEGVNLRDDRYGGDVHARLRLTVDVVRAIRGAVGDDFIVGLRSSQGKVNDFEYRWNGGEAEAAAIYSALGALPLDYVHTTAFEAWAPAFAWGPSLAALARRHSRHAIMANGSLHDPQRAVEAVASGEADVVTLGRGALTHADWPRRIMDGRSIAAFDAGILTPIADLANAARIREGCRTGAMRR